MKILIVDDSAVFRTQITNALAKQDWLTVVGTAANGQIALQKIAELKPDLITLDMEMPVLDGIGTMLEIRKQGLKTRVLFFSSQTTHGAEVALEALRSGADDVLAKPTGSMTSLDAIAESISSILVPKIRQFWSPSATNAPVAAPEKSSSPIRATGWSRTIPEPGKFQKINLSIFKPAALVIGSSTGGPQALEKLFTLLKGSTQIPIFIVQHMPPVFTQILAKRIYETSGILCAEGIHGEKILNNRMYIAPGDFHMGIKNGPEGFTISLDQTDQRNSVRPAVDVLFETAAANYGQQLMSVVLTGMGEDGAIGAVAIKKNLGGVMIQSRESCVVYGMPGAVEYTNAFDGSGNLEEIAKILQPMLRSK